MTPLATLFFDQVKNASGVCPNAPMQRYIASRCRFNVATSRSFAASYSAVAT